MDYYVGFNVDFEMPNNQYNFIEIRSKFKQVYNKSNSNLRVNEIQSKDFQKSMYKGQGNKTVFLMSENKLMFYKIKGEIQDNDSFEFDF